MATLQEATAADAALISRIIATSWKSAYQGLIDDAYLARLPEEYWLPSMRSWLDSGRMYGYIAVEGGLPVGCVVLGRGRDDGYAAWGEIVSLYVLPEAMGKGVGSLLLEKASADLHADGYDHIYLWTIAGYDHADRFYRRHGFAPTKDRVHYRIGGQNVTDIRYIREE